MDFKLIKTEDLEDGSGVWTFDVSKDLIEFIERKLGKSDATEKEIGDFIINLLIEETKRQVDNKNYFDKIGEEI